MITNTTSCTSARTRWNASLNADDHEHDVLLHQHKRELQRRRIIIDTDIERHRRPSATEQTNPDTAHPQPNEDSEELGRDSDAISVHEVQSASSSSYSVTKSPECHHYQCYSIPRHSITVSRAVNAKIVCIEPVQAPLNKHSCHQSKHTTSRYQRILTDHMSPFHRITSKHTGIARSPLLFELQGFRLRQRLV
jgi:hypothetical protein